MIKSFGILFLVWTLLTSQLAMANPFLSAHKEEKGHYLTYFPKLRIKRLLRDFDKETLSSYWQESLKPAEGKQLCELDIFSKLDSLYKKRNFKRRAKGLIYFARQEKLIDDTSVRILRDSLKVFKKKDKIKKSLFSPLYKVEEKDKVLATFEKIAQSKGCLGERYKALIGLLKKDELKTSRFSLKKYNYLALKNNVIDRKTFNLFEAARKKKIDKDNQTLTSYIQLRRQILKQFPLKPEDKGSQFIGDKIKGEKLSLRERLYQKYDFFQILMLSDLMDKMRKRIDAALVKIIVYDTEGNIVEELSLSPMEQYRFAAKMVRKEIDEAVNSNLFNGKKIDYLDLVAAAFETGLIPSEEIEHVAAIEEIWNPKKTLWEKIAKVITTYGGLTSVLLPPGWNFIPMLVILGIQASLNRDGNEQNRDFSLF